MVKAGLLSRPARSVNESYDEIPQQIPDFTQRGVSPYPINLGNKPFFSLLHDPCGKGSSRSIRFSNKSMEDVLNIEGREGIVRLIVGMVGSMLDSMELGVMKNSFVMQ